MKTELSRALWTLFVGLLLSTTANATVIGAGGGSLVQSWGKDAGTPNTQTYGQTIVVPTDNVLNNFSFWLGPTSTNFPVPSNPSLSFMAYVYAWDGSHAVGPALYTSGVLTHDATPVTPFTEYTFNTGDLSLTTANMYVLFLSTSGLAGDGHIQWEAATSDEYPDGSFVFLNNGEDASQWTTETWGAGFTSDLHFEATFSAATTVPEPSTWIMLVTALLALTLVTRRSRRERRNLTEV
jgi:hypothetical protein